MRNYVDNPYCKDVVLIKSKNGNRIDFEIACVCKCSKCGEEFKKVVRRKQNAIRTDWDCLCFACERERKKEYQAERTRQKKLEEKKACTKHIKKFLQELLRDIKKCENVSVIGYESIKKMAETTLSNYLEEGEE